MTVIVQIHSRDERREFDSRDEAEAWLRKHCGATIFSQRLDGVVDCLSPLLSSVARILPAEVSE
jgi:hypothetical protein